MSEEKDNGQEKKNINIVLSPTKDEFENVNKLEKAAAVSNDPEKNFVASEGGWGWVVVLACSYNIGMLVGLMNNYAIIINGLDKAYNGTENHIFYASWIGSSSNGLQFFLCMVGGVLSGYFGPRKVGVTGGLITAVSCLGSAFVTEIKVYFLTQSVILAIGQSFLLASTLAILPHYFQKKLSLVNGIANSLGSIIVVIMPIISDTMINKYGLKETFLLLAGMNVLSAALCLTYREVIPNNKKESFILRMKKSFGVDVFKNRNYNIWLIATFFGMFGYLIPIVNIDHHSINAFPEYKPWIINVVFSSAALVAALIFGILGDYTKFNPVHYHTGVFVIYGVVQITIPYATSFYWFMLQLIILGALDGIWLSFKVPISRHLVGCPSLSNQGTGYYHTAMTLTVVAGPATAGYLFEIYKNYDLAFIIGGTSNLVCAFILIVGILVPELIASCMKRNDKTHVDKKEVGMQEINYY